MSVSYFPLLAWNNASQWFSTVQFPLLFWGATIQPNFTISHFLDQFMKFCRINLNTVLQGSYLSAVRVKLR